MSADISSASKKDGTLVYIKDDEVAPNKWGIGEVYFYNDKLGKFLSIPEDTLGDIVALKHCKKSGSYYEDKKAANEASRLQIPEIYEILEGGRINVVLLLNSLGGHGTSMRRLLKAIEYVEQNGGEAFSFGGHNIMSAAANLFVAPNVQNRYLLKRSTLLFHMSSNAYAKITDEEIEELLQIEREDNPEATRGMIVELLRRSRERDRQESMIELRQLILSSIASGSRDRIGKVIDREFADPDNIDNAIAFNGEGAVEFGFANRFCTPEDLCKTFNKISQIQTNVHYGTKIDDFFDRIDLEYERRLFGLI